MPRTRSRSSASAVPLDSRASASSLRAAAGSRSTSLLGQAEAHAQRDQPGLGAVVQVAFDPAQLGRLGVDGVGPGDGQLRDPQRQLGGPGGREEEPGERGRRPRRSHGAAPQAERRG